MKSIDDYILDRVNEKKRGSIFTNKDFNDLGNAVSLRVALHRLVKRGELLRVGRGLFVKPEMSKLLNKEVKPDLEAIARAIARRDSARLLPTGSYAMYVLGLSTQIPLNLVYYTDGKARKITIGKSQITFKKASPKKLAYKGKISKLVILALSEIGKDNATKQDLVKLKEIIKKEKIQDLKHDLLLAPQWIAELITKMINE